MTCLIAVISSIVLIIILIIQIVKLCHNETLSWRGATKIVMYISSSVVIWMAVPTAGSFLVFKIEMETCNYTTYNVHHILAVAIVAMILIGVTIVLWILLLCAFNLESEV